MTESGTTETRNLHLNQRGWVDGILHSILQLFAICKLLLLSIWRNSWCESKARLDGKTVIITGCNIGIGKETCKDLVKRGARVIMACRDLTKAGEAAAEIRQTEADEIVVKRLDLTSLTSVREFAAEVLREEPAIHLLINNAGVMMHPEARTADGFETHLGVNHLGHFLLTLLLLARLRESAPARIITVASSAHAGGSIDFDDIHLAKSYDPWRAYCQSKLANVLFSRELAKQLHGSGVTTYSLHPGVVNTHLGRYMTEGLNIITQKFILLMSYIFMNTAAKGAQTTIHCAVEETLENTSGKFYVDCRETEPELNATHEDDSLRLWKVSLEMVNLDKLSGKRDT